jgi:glycosyltransferase involved in cell wall biosynthesis
MKFSIVTPTWNRWGDKLMRCMWSVQRQQFYWGHEFPEFEHIIVDDGSTDETEERIGNLLYGDEMLPPTLEYIYYRKIKHAGRVVARNEGMNMAIGEWICWLDSDDALDPMYLATFDYYIKKFPKVKLWVCGVVVHAMDGDKIEYTKLRPAWKPPLNEDPELDWVHADFSSGKVGSGMFMFHRSLLEQAWPMPDWRNFEALADGIDDYLGYVTGYSYAKKWVGNPWGDDHAFFRKLTMFAEVEVIEPCLYVNYRR